MTRGPVFCSPVLQAPGLEADLRKSWLHVGVLHSVYKDVPNCLTSQELLAFTEQKQQKQKGIAGVTLCLLANLFHLAR